MQSAVVGDPLLGMRLWGWETLFYGICWEPLEQMKLFQKQKKKLPTTRICIFWNKVSLLQPVWF